MEKIETPTQTPEQIRIAELEALVAALTTEATDKTAQLAAYTFAVTAENVVAIHDRTVKSEEELMTLILDIQAHDDRDSFAETVASLLVSGAVARQRSIDYSRKTQEAKDLQERMGKYTAWARTNPQHALNPIENLTKQLGLGLIAQDHYIAMMSALNNAQSSVKTQLTVVDPAEPKKSA
jgi:hypothetical protein